MEAYAQLGQRSAALRQYEELTSTLRRELGTEPLAATQALHARIVHGELTTVETPTPARSVAPIHHKSSSGPFVGRIRETALLNEALQKAEHGPAQIVLLSGELGIGKSTLWQHWAQKVEATKTVLTTRLSRIDAGIALCAFGHSFWHKGSSATDHTRRFTRRGAVVDGAIATASADTRSAPVLAKRYSPPARRRAPQTLRSICAMLTRPLRTAAYSLF